MVNLNESPLKMKKSIRLLILAAAVAASNVALAAADDVKWVNQCVKDNKDEGAKADVVKKYCECMNEKMDDNETLSITAWEKKNPKIANACSRQAGWK